MDQVDLLPRFISILTENNISYCVIGGQAVNAYADPLVSLDLDVVVWVDALPSLLSTLPSEMRIEEFSHSLNLSMAGSDLRIQLHTDPRYQIFLTRSRAATVLGLLMPVAAVEDVLAGKVWAALDQERRGSKRQKDLADIARLLEAQPALRTQVPPELLERLL